MHFETVSFSFDGFCFRLADSRVRCGCGYDCERCEISARIEEDTGSAVVDRILFSWRDALPQTPTHNAETWFRKPVILSPEAMKRLGLPSSLRYQIFFAEDGPGVFKHNPTGEIDGVLLCNARRIITVSRNECYGLPNERACRRYDEYYARLGVRRLADFFEFSSPPATREFKKERRNVP